MGFPLRLADQEVFVEGRWDSNGACRVDTKRKRGQSEDEDAQGRDRLRDAGI